MKGRRIASRTLTLYLRDNEMGRVRLGLAVGRKLGNAVVRNRIKRRLRELVRECLATTGAGWDVVIVARQAAVDAGFTELKADLVRAWAGGGGAKQASPGGK